MSDYAAFCPFVNRLDLLQNLIVSVQPLWDDFTIIDNSGKEIGAKPNQIKVFRPPVPLLFTQSMNWELEETLRRGKTFCIHMHNDAVIPDGTCERLLEYARNVNKQSDRWGVIYTLYDILCVYNPKVFEDIGGYDTVFPAYFSDNDYYRRMELAGWVRIDSGISVGHGPEGQGSQTINSDPYLRHLNGVTFPLYREYYRAKWGGVVGEERFTVPFGVPPDHWKIGKIA
jgi:hypothetical protein